VDSLDLELYVLCRALQMARRRALTFHTFMGLIFDLQLNLFPKLSKFSTLEYFLKPQNPFFAKASDQFSKVEILFFFGEL
jgi:hypothetical protein